MNKIVKRILYSILFLVLFIIIAALVLAYLPTTWKISNKGITPEVAAVMRTNFSGPHEQFTTSDGETLFLRRWNPDSIEPAKKNIAVLIFHGFTAYSGPYNMAGVPFSKGGYTTFGLDYRGHGLSGGNRNPVVLFSAWAGLDYYSLPAGSRRHSGRHSAVFFRVPGCSGGGLQHLHDLEHLEKT